jgi:hypothetical protein
VSKKSLFLIWTLFFVVPAQADIFKCKNGKGKITYQQSPCSDTTVGTVAREQDADLEDQIRAQMRVEQMKEGIRLNEATEAARRQQNIPARTRERPRFRPIHCTPDYAGGMHCF